MKNQPPSFQRPIQNSTPTINAKSSSIGNNEINTSCTVKSGILLRFGLRTLAVPAAIFMNTRAITG